ncbi:MAG: ATP-binding protein [Nitrospirae bacterium]|nr:ATP-binding protein [Nitrospirota bacterium]
MLNPSIILLLIISFLYLALGLFVFLKNPKERVNRSFALMALSGFIWINSSFLEDAVSSIDTRFFLLKLDFASGIFASFFLLLFCLDISKSAIADRAYVRRLLVVIPVLFSALIFFARSVLSGYEMVEGVISPVFGSGHLLYNFLIGASLFSGVGTLMLRYRESSPEDKTKFVYLFIGFLLTSIIAFSTNILLADYIKNSQQYSLYSRLGIFGSVFLILFSGYAIVRHRLLNIKVITTELLSLGILVFSLFQVLKSGSISDLMVNGIAFLVLLAFVIMLVRSVENEVRRKEELQTLSDRLAAANEKLRELDQARAEFMSMASHQLQTPLTSIKGFASLLLEGSGGALTDAEKDMIGKISVSSERMVQLVEDYLNLSRIESGKMEYKFEKWRMEDICQEVADVLALKAKEKNLYLKFVKPTHPLPEVTIDGPKVREVISNLVDNAIKYTPEGGVTVTVESRHKGPDERMGFIRVTVVDTGMGIAGADIPNLFAKFSRVRDEQHMKVKGTGLGLYVGKVMIEANGGRIWAESDGVGKGSRFIVEIPVERSNGLIRNGRRKPA